MQDFKQLRKLIRENYLNRINNSNKPFVIYKKKKIQFLTSFYFENLEKGLNISSDYSISGSYRSGDIRHNYADLSNLKRIIDTDKFVKFEDGISRFTSWVLDQSLPFQDYEGSLKELKSKGLLS